jgi:hypothetical protein
MRSRTFLLSTLILTLALALPKTSSARAAMPTLEELTKSAQLIVVARVEEISTDKSDAAGHFSGVSAISWKKRVATARVLEVWKGTAAGETVKFRASKSWTCDVSTAVVGETVVLFLTDDAKDPAVMAIAFNGIGRLPLERNSVLLYSSLLTKEIKALLALPQETFRYPVEIYTLKQQVQQLMAESANKTKERTPSVDRAARKG